MDAELKKPDTGISSIDRKILKILLSPDVGKSTKSMSAKLGIPVTTVRRRRIV